MFPLEENASGAGMAVVKFRRLYNVVDDHFISKQTVIDRLGDHGALSHSCHPVPEVNLVAAVISEAYNRAVILAGKSKPGRWGALGRSEQIDTLAEREELVVWCSMKSNLPWQLGWCADVMRIFTKEEVSADKLAERIMGALNRGKWDRCTVVPERRDLRGR